MICFFGATKGEQEKMESDSTQRVRYKSKNWCTFLDQAAARQTKSGSNEVQSEIETYKAQLTEFMRHYHSDSEHSEELKSCYKEYEDAGTKEFNDKYYCTLDAKELDDALSMCAVMIVTANDIEKAILHSEIAKTGSKISRFIGRQNSYFIFKWGKYYVAHVHQGETGANKDMGTNSTICEALKHFTPNVIISLGVAFGIDYTVQHLGDVLVSKRILPYSENKRDEDMLKPDRSQDKTIDGWLHVRLQNAAEFLKNVTYGDILTGGSVMSSFEEKDKICLGYTKSDFVIGGEMEGNAVFQTSKRIGIPGVVMKGICDWGVAKNDIYPEDPEKEEQFKESLQAFAMKKAVESCFLLMRDKALFSRPKNENVDVLQKQNKIAKVIAVIPQVLILVSGVLSLILPNIRSEVSVTLLSMIHNPFVWIGVSSIFLILSYFTLISKGYNLIKYIRPKKRY